MWNHCLPSPHPTQVQLCSFPTQRLPLVVPPVPCWLKSINLPVISMSSIPRALAHLELVQWQGGAALAQTSRSRGDLPKQRLLPCEGIQVAAVEIRTLPGSQRSRVSPFCVALGRFLSSEILLLAIKHQGWAAWRIPGGAASCSDV